MSGGNIIYTKAYYYFYVLQGHAREMNSETAWLLGLVILVPLLLTSLVVLRIGHNWGYQRRVADEKKQGGGGGGGGGGFGATLEKIQQELKRLSDLITTSSGGGGSLTKSRDDIRYISDDLCQKTQ